MNGCFRIWICVAIICLKGIHDSF